MAKILGDDRRRLLAEHIVEPALLDLLGTLRRSGQPFQLTTRELAEGAGVTPAAISQRLTRAQHRGLVTRTSGPGRSINVTLTDQGLELIDATAGKIFDRERELLAALTGREREMLAEVLHKLVLQLDDPGPIPTVGDLGH